ncbi:MAG: hypothetical protein QJR00_02165, partial [Bacillota bacterium]|nr:hypothetical protein [Bacillota bacterium]
MKRYLWAGLLLVLLAGCQRPLPAIPAMPPAVATLRVAADFTPTEEMVWQRLMAQLAAETKLPLYVEMVPPGTEDADLAVEASLPEEALLQGTFTLLPLDDDPYLLLYRGRVEAALPSTWEEVTGLSRRLSALPGWDPQLLPAIALSPQAPDVLLALAFQGEGDLPLALATLKKWV